VFSLLRNSVVSRFRLTFGRLSAEELDAEIARLREKLRAAQQTAGW
jgi:hypothetical protein